MATKPHKSLTGSDLHEPKGIEVAAPGQVYVSDGLGSGSWVTVDIQSSWSTGDVKLTYKTTADTGWLMMADTSTIGNTGSGATYEGGGYNALFTLLWNNIPAYIGLVLPGRGGSAASDWSAGKKISLPRVLGRALAGAGTGIGLTARDLGSHLIGEETHALTSEENGPHDHSVTGTTGTSNQNLNHSHQYLQPVLGNFQPGSEVGVATYTTAITFATDLTPHNHSFAAVASVSGSGTPHNNMQPTTFVNVMIKV